MISPFLKGIRVLDFTWAWAGPYATALLNFMGAEVIKVESLSRLDHSRMRTLASGPTYKGHNFSNPFHDINVGKKSITLNLSKPEAIEIIKKLVPLSDIVVNNFRPGTLEKLGLGYEVCRELKPDIVYMSASACGAKGPERFYVGYAPSFAALGGISHLTGYPDQKPVAVGGRADMASGASSAFYMLAALYHKESGGAGQEIDLSNREILSAQIGEVLLDQEANGRTANRTGNLSDTFFPHDVYPCLGHEKGKDQWLSIEIETPEEWARLCRVLGREEWASDPALASAEGRRARGEEIDGAIKAWTLLYSQTDGMLKLQEAGVPAAAALNSKHMFEDEHLAARKIFFRVKPEGMEERWNIRAPFLSNLPTEEILPAPMLGQHNDYVFGELLGMSREEIERLAEAEVIR